MALVSNFSYTTSGLSVDFTDRTVNPGGPAVSTWNWNFGDGNSSTSQNPSHTYASPGIYGVILVAGDGVTTNTIVRYLFVTSEAGVIPVTIMEMVLMKIPPTLYDTQNILTYIQRYQLMLREAPETEITLANVFNESAWPSMYNVLIAELVVLECIREMASIYASSGSLINTQITSSTTGGEETVDKELKSVKTGPAEAEWFSKNETIAELTDKYSQYYYLLFGKQNIVEELQKSVCMLASSLEVYLPTICGEQKLPYFGFDVVTPTDMPDAKTGFKDNPLTNL